MMGKQADFYHDAGIRPEQQPRAYQDYLAQCESTVWPDLALPKAHQQSLQEYIQKEKRCHWFLREAMEVNVKNRSGSDTIFGMVTPDGQVLEFFGTQEALEKMMHRGIHDETDWSLPALGANAISVGVLEQKEMSSCGDENSCPLLHPFAVYYAPILFAPVTLEDEYIRQPRLIGGVCIIVSKKNANPDYLTLANTIARIALHRVTSSVRARMYQSMLNPARITFYFPQNQPGAEPVLSCVPENFFQMIGRPPADCTLEPMRTLIDPRPANADLWSILATRSSVDNLEMTVSFQGRDLPCTVSAHFYYQPDINLAGGYLFIATPQWLSYMLSKQTKNVSRDAFTEIIGDSPAMKVAKQRAILMSQVRGNVLLLGESGTGKEVFARAIHSAGPRRNKPFIAVNCGALPKDLIVSELFGYDRGAFTGAKSQGQAGKFELAHEGTLFLDEIGELPLEQQAMLLRVVEERKVTRLGSNRVIPVDIQIICATNANLKQMVEQKNFREDLYYRISAFQLNLPPLREREDDCLLIAEHFISQYAAAVGRTDIITLDEDARRLLRSYPWYGNIRELRNVIEYIVYLYPVRVITGQIVRDALSPDYAIPEEPAAPPSAPEPTKVKSTAEISEQRIREALEAANGNRSAAAKALGIARRTLYNYIDKFQI